MTADYYSIATVASLYAGRPRPAPPPPPTGDYRYYTDRPYLFDRPPASAVVDPSAALRYIYPARASIPDPKNNYQLSNFGPSRKRICGTFEWANVGGDWVNTAGTPQATTLPHIAFAANAATSGAATYTVDVTAAMNAVTRYNAWLFSTTAGNRSLATNYHATPPYIDVVYANGETGRLNCYVGARLVGSSDYGNAGAPAAYTNSSERSAFEFDRPLRQVTSATLVMVVEGHSATAATIQGYLANPPRNTNPVVQGVAAGFLRDQGIDTDPGVFYGLRFQDGSALSDWVVEDNQLLNLSAWSPHLFNRPGVEDAAPNYSKLPYLNPGKIRATGLANTSLVSSGYSGDGFEPLAPGLGALRVVIPGRQSAADGDVTGDGGAWGITARLFLPEDVAGLLDELYVRQYIRLGTSPAEYLATMKMFRESAGSAAIYATHGGKFGFGHSHWTNFGGNNQVGGGNIGWLNRCFWREAPADANPGGGLLGGVHSLDNLGYDMPWGQIGGLGNMLFPGFWYCVETRLKLNTVDTSTNPFEADPALNLSDAEMDVWIDGRKVAEFRNFSYRKLPLDYSGASSVSGIGILGRTPISAGKLVPIRQLGHLDVALNDFQGGTLTAETDRVKFYAGLVVSKSYIGPMKMVESPPPAWLPAPGSVAAVPAANTWDSIRPANTGTEGYSYGIKAYESGDPKEGLGYSVAATMALAWPKVLNDYSGGVYNPYYQHTPGTYGCMVFHGGGHSATNWNGVAIFDFNSGQYYIVCPGSTLMWPPADVAPDWTFPACDAINVEGLDGQPGSPHSYDTLLIVGPEAGYPKGGLLTCVRAAFFNSNAGGCPVHVFDFAHPELKWQRIWSPPDLNSKPWGSGYASVYDPQLLKAYTIGAGNGDIMKVFDLVARTHVNATLPAGRRLPSARQPDSMILRYVPSRRMFVYADLAVGTNVRRLYWAPADTILTDGFRPVTLSSALPTGGHQLGFAWITPQNRALLRCQNQLTQLYGLEIPADPTTTWAVTSVPFTGGEMPNAYVSGQRFTYAEPIGGIVYKALADSPMQVYTPN